MKAGTKLRFFSPVELEEIFMHAEGRTVSKYGVINFESNTYEAPAELLGKPVVVRYSPFHLEYLHVYYKDKYFGIAIEVQLVNQCNMDKRTLFYWSKIFTEQLKAG